MKPISFLLSEQPKVAVDVDYTNPEALANQLFLISAEYYNQVNLQEQDNFQAVIKDFNTVSENTQLMVSKSIQTYSTLEIIVYWVKVMDELIKKGDYTSSVSVGVALKGLQYNSSSKIQAAFALLPEQFANSLHSLPTTRVTNLNFYNEVFVTIPYIGLYPKIQSTQGDASGLDVRTDDTFGKLGQFTATCKKTLIHSLVKATQEVEEALVGQVEHYRKKYMEFSGSVALKKVSASTQLLGIIKEAKSLTIRLKQLNEFIENIAESLEHKAGYSAKEFTLVAFAKDLRQVTIDMMSYQSKDCVRVSVVGLFARSSQLPKQRNSGTSDASDMSDEMRRLSTGIIPA